MMATAVTAKCPECEADVKLAADVEKGEIVPCADCGAELAIAVRDGHAIGDAVVHYAVPFHRAG